MFRPSHRRRSTVLAVASTTLFALAAPAWGKPAPVNTYTAYATTANGGEPSIGFDTARNAAVYGAGTANKRLIWDDSTVPATMTVADAKAPTSLTSGRHHLH